MQLFLTICSYHNSCSYRNNCGFRLHAGDLKHKRKKKNRSSYVFLLIFMFCYSRFRFRNLKDANSCMFAWCITTRSLLICSWHDTTLSQLFLVTMFWRRIVSHQKQRPFKSSGNEIGIVEAKKLEWIVSWSHSYSKVLHK